MARAHANREAGTPWPAQPPSAEHRAAYATAVPRSYWLDRLPARAPLAPLRGERSTDLAIVGGGFTGLWAALQAKARDPERAIVLLEAETVAFGASGRNGGFLPQSLTHGLANGLARFADEIDVLERLGRENFDGLQADLEHYGIDCDLACRGEITVALAEHETTWLEEEADLARAHGHDVELLDRAAMQAEVASPTYHGGLWARTGHALVDPAKLADGLRQAALATGVEIHERAGPQFDQREATFARLSQHFFATFPQLAGIRFSHRWGGAIDTCSRFSVFFGTALGGRVAYATGYTGLGVGASRFGAAAALDLLDERTSEATALRYVRRKPVPFPAEPLRWAVIELTRNRLAAADRRQGRRGLWLRSLDWLGLGFDS